ncbi:hypothetical protein BH24ACT21_BH24ACT21_00480 [soil metagenome]|jgi:dolichol-phosphate mannosyltransferase
MEAENQVTQSRGAAEKSLLTLIVPTRNEADNVPKLADELRRSLSDIDYRVVFVDDSTDNTPEVIRNLQKENGRIALIHREEAEREGGLSTAVTTGMEAVVDDSVYACVMDADLQHPPEKVREMLEIAQSHNADVVVASRYTPGGSYAGLSGPVRRGVSVGTKYLAQVVFREARKTSDPLTGFFLVRSQAISGIQFRPTGFKILLEILVCAPELKVVEAPFDFQARNAGVSKASMNQGMEYLTHILSLFWYVPSAGRFWKFAMVGASGALVNLLIYTYLTEFYNANYVIAWMFGVGISILSNFVLNNAFTWRDVRHSSRIHYLQRGALAYPVAVIGIGANFAVWYPLIKYVSKEFPYHLIFWFLGILAATVVNFVLSARFVFRRPTPKDLNIDLPPKEITAEITDELKAEKTVLIQVPGLSPLGDSHGLNAADRSVIEMVANTAHPTLTITGPRRLPQARTNARWLNSLAVPVFQDERTVGVVYATRNSTEPFTEEDLHWLTSYVSPAAPIFE